MPVEHDQVGKKSSSLEYTVENCHNALVPNDRNQTMIRLAHLINNLQTGGAETTLLRLMEHVDRDRFEPCVIAMIGEGTIGPRLRELGIEVVALGAARRRISAKTFLGIRKHLRAFQPDVIQSWMYHSNLAAYFARRSVRGRPPLAWNIRHSLHDLAHEPWLTRQVVRSGARRSKRVQAIVFNSAVSMAQHEKLGYQSPRNQIIPNGFDLDEIRPVPHASEELRSELCVNDSTLLVGCAARFHPMKDQRSLSSALKQLLDQGHDVQCVLAGRGCEPGGLAEALRIELGDRLHLLGERQPLAAVLSGLDCLVVSSRWGEGFPNVLAEAMACETPCVTTDVGDAAEILGDSERVVGPGDVTALASAIEGVLKRTPEQRRAIGVAGRQRIAERFPLSNIMQRYETLWSDLAGG
ncbi:MAG: glycosyltransferase [Planctomycetota bacterium]|nr:glycosyltransferase [Planctomycetota bacterium]